MRVCVSAKDLEQFVERAEAARKSDERHRPLKEVQLANREIVEGEGEVRGNVRVHKLLTRQADVEPDCLGLGVECASVRCLHDAGAAPCHDQHLPVRHLAVGVADETAELAGDLVIATLVENPLSDSHMVRGLRVLRIVGQGVARGLDPAARLRRLANPRAAEHDDRPLDLVRPERELGLEVVHLQAQAADRVAGKKVEILTRDAVGRRVHGRGEARQAHSR